MSRFVVLRNYLTGEYVMIDTWQRRFENMCKRLRHWQIIANDIYPDCEMRHVTLTYDLNGNILERPRSWQPNDVNDFLRKMRGQYYGYAWVMELHKSGNPHYHVNFVTDRELRVKWENGISHVSQSQSIKVDYLVEHALKPVQKDYKYFPKGARSYGLGLCGCGKAMNLHGDKNVNSDWDMVGHGGFNRANEIRISLQEDQQEVF
jgi:hypothetical protein